MIKHLCGHKSAWPFQLIVGMVISAFIFTLPGISYAQVVDLPSIGSMLGLTREFSPPLIKGLMIHPENPLQFDFLIDPGHVDFKDKTRQDKTKEYAKLVKYFLASLTVPEKDLWVNLSPYEKDRIIPKNFGKTEMGRDLLGQDYILKQLTASLMYPEKELGQEFWQKIYKEARERFGTTEIPVNTFNKVWIIPDRASVYEKGNTVFLVDSHLKVMLEEDYLALDHNSLSEELGTNQLTKKDIKDVSSVSSQVVREIVIPAIEKEVNEGKNFALLRQINNSLILATWYKTALKESLLGKIYIDRSKTDGINQEDIQTNQKIYEQYLEAFKKGVYNYIKEEYDPVTQEIIPRKYFSGGYSPYNPGLDNPNTPQDESSLAGRIEKLDPALPRAAAAIDAAMTATSPSIELVTVNLDEVDINVSDLAKQVSVLRGEFLGVLDDLSSGNDGSASKRIVSLKAELGKDEAMIAADNIESLVPYFANGDMMRRTFNPDMWEALASQWDPDNLEIVRTRLRQALTVLEGLMKARDAVRAFMQEFEAVNPGKEPGSILSELDAQTHAGWLDGEKENINFVAYTPEVHALLIEAAKNGVLRDNNGNSISLEQFQNPKKKFKFSGYNFDANAFPDQDAWRNYLARLQSAAKSNLGSGVIINTVAGEWNVLSSLQDSQNSKRWRTERPKYLHTLQADAVGAMLSAIKEPKLMAIVSGGIRDRQKVTEALVTILRRVNVGWRLNNPWNWKDFFQKDSLLSRPFGFEENGGIGLDMIIKDARVLKAILHVLHRRINDIHIDGFIKEGLVKAFENGLDEILTDLTDAAKLEEAILAEGQKTEYKTESVLAKQELEGQVPLAEPKVDEAMLVVTLNNGSQELLVEVMVTMGALNILFKNIPGVLAAYDLREILRDPSYKMSHASKALLQSLGLMDENGGVHDSIKNIVLSAIVGEELEMTLVSPIREDSARTLQNNVFIAGQMEKLKTNYEEDAIEWEKISPSDENKRIVFESMDATRLVLAELLQEVDGHESLRREKAKIHKAIELVFDKQGRSLRKDLKFYPIHPLQAALNFIKKFGITDPDFILSAILHDSIEDVEEFTQNPGLIGEMFGAKVQANIESVTNKELPKAAKEWLTQYIIEQTGVDPVEGKKSLDEVVKIIQYQLGVSREIIGHSETLLLKSVDFSDNALTQSNLAGNPSLQERLSSKYRDLISIFAEEFLALADEERAKGGQGNSALMTGLEATAAAYQAGYEEVSGYSQSWEHAGLLNKVVEAIQRDFGGLRGLKDKVERDFAVDAAMLSIQTQEMMTDRVVRANPVKHSFIKDAPILGYRIVSGRWEDIPESIRTHLGSMDQTKYPPGYLEANIGSIIGLQMNGDQPDFYIVGKGTFEDKYRVVDVNEVRAKNGEVFGKLTAVQGVGDLISGNDPNLIGALKTTPVEMIKMSEIGYPVEEPVTIQPPSGGERTKPAGQDAYLVLRGEKYSMANINDRGNPIGYVSVGVASDAAMLGNTDQKRKVGGIDLNPANLNLQIKRDGKGVPLPIQFQDLQNINVNGFLPVIIKITPISNLPLLLGINPNQGQESLSCVR